MELDDEFMKTDDEVKEVGFGGGDEAKEELVVVDLEQETGTPVIPVTSPLPSPPPSPRRTLPLPDTETESSLYDLLQKTRKLARTMNSRSKKLLKPKKLKKGGMSEEQWTATG